MSAQATVPRRSVPAGQGRRTFPIAGAVTVTAGGQSLTVAGREASMLVELALAAGTIRPLRYGRVTLAFTPDKVELSITQTEPPVHLEG